MLDKKENMFETLFPLGSTFKYMGIKMRVRDHWGLMAAGTSGIWCYPCLQAEYVDKNGVFHKMEFRLDSLEELKKENNK